MFSRRRSTFIAVGAAVLAVGGGAYGIVSATAGNSSAAATTPTAAAAAQHGTGGAGSNARSGPAAGGTVGTVESVSSSSFTLTTPAGQTVTVTQASASKGENVLVLGTVDGTTIAAGKVIAQATDGSAKSSAAGVVPFQQGARSTSKQAGRIPASYSPGSGTIVSGTAANKATEAALAAYPGGIVDRVVEIGNGEYEVHTIGVSWPHHVFVDENFTVVGAN